MVIAEDKEKLPVLEGPKLYKRNGWYYIFAPIGGVETRAAGGRPRARHPRALRMAHGARAGHHADPGAAPGRLGRDAVGQGWFAHFNSTGAFGRIVHLQPVVWRDDWPVIGQPIPARTRVSRSHRSRCPTPGSPPTDDRLQDSDEFAVAARSGLQWSWNHNPLDGAWSLAARPGWLRLAAQPAQHSSTARNTLTQILQGPRPA